MTRAEELRALAERYAAATEGSEELDRMIADLVLERLPDVRLAGSPISLACYRYPDGTQGTELRFSRAIDAALTLVPAGWTWRVSNRAPQPFAGRAYIHNGELIYSGYGMSKNAKHRSEEVVAPTAPLALCAASLRALAAEAERGQE